MSNLACDKCGKSTPVHLLDAKPGPGNFTPEQLSRLADQGAHFTRLECESCYGPGFLVGVGLLQVNPTRLPVE